MKFITRRLVDAFALCSVLTAAPAFAQDPAASGLKVEQLESGWVVAPDARFAQINDRTATLAGVYGGYLTDRTFLVGAGAYWLANRADDFKMQYYGGIVRWTFGGYRTLGVSTGAFVGFGDATLSQTYGDIVSEVGGADFHGGGRHGGGPVFTPDTRVRVNENFFIAEPQVNAVWTIASWVRLDAGVGYRIVGAADILGDELRGPSGTISIQFGGGR